MVRPSKRTPPKERSALALFEQAIALLRSAPPQALGAYLIGSLPFVLGLLYFWTDMSHNAFAAERSLMAAMGMALLFFWMKTWQSQFTIRLHAHLTGSPSPGVKTTTLARSGIHQGFIHAVGLFVLPLSLLLVVPFVWVYTFYQNCTVYGGDPELSPKEVVHKARREARRWPLQNHYVTWLASPFMLTILCAVCLLVLPWLRAIESGYQIFIYLSFGLLLLLTSPITVVVALNYLALLFFIPQLFKILFGLHSFASESTFTLLFNTSTFAAVCALTYLTLDPVMKAIYVLRCFYGEALYTGADIRAVLRRQTAAPVTRLIILASIGSLGLQPPAVEAAPEPGDPQALHKAIDQEIRKAEYAWRMPKELREQLDEETDGGWLSGLGESMRNFLGEALEELTLWLRNLFTLAPDPRLAKSSGLDWSALMKLLLYLALMVLVGSIVYVLARMIKEGRREEPGAPVEEVAIPPDLHDEAVSADQLPSDEWLDLARAMVREGNYRLAVRACFLSGLAHISNRELVRIRRFKSNRDYQRELARRAHSLPEVSEVFGWSVQHFEGIWYGEHVADENLYQAFNDYAQKVKGLC